MLQGICFLKAWMDNLCSRQAEEEAIAKGLGFFFWWWWGGSTW